MQQSTISVSAEDVVCSGSRLCKLNETRQTGPTTMDPKLTYHDDGLSQIVMEHEHEKIHRKLRKVQQRRDHYARLYYKTLAELDETKWELSLAKAKIRELQTNGHHRATRRSGSNTTSPDSGTSLSPAIAQHSFAKPHAFTLPKSSTDKYVPTVEPANLTESWRNHSTRPFTLALPKPTFHKPPGFKRSSSLSQGDAIVNDQKYFINPPSFQRRLSVPQSLPTSKSMSSFSAFQPPNSSTLPRTPAGFLHTPSSEPRTPAGFLHTPSSEPRTPAGFLQSRYTPSESSRASVSSASTSGYPLPEEVHYHHLTGVQLLDLLAHICSPECAVKTLEIASSKLGQPGAMQVFCKDLIKNKTITSLSLPDNNIGVESLRILLDNVQECTQLKELLLRNNRIGIDCAGLIKQFLSKTALDSLVLTGNEIEQFSHLLSGELPSEFSMEYGGSGESSVDSGVIHEQKNTKSINSSFKYMNI